MSREDLANSQVRQVPVGLFDRTQLKRLRPAAEEIVWLLGRGYPLHTSVEIVGKRCSVSSRERMRDEPKPYFPASRLYSFSPSP